jgi:type III pantothenate kinase
MQLLIDFGNSRLKWSVWDGQVLLDQSTIDLLALESGLRGLEWSQINAVHLCSVADADLTHAVAVYCDSLSSPQCQTDEIDLSQLPAWFSLGTTSPEQIGKDRVMAMLGAFTGNTSYCVIDAGTACTVDYVISGEHLGGYIVPGLALSRSSLTRQSARIGEVVDHLYSAKLEPGRNTQEAVEHGIRTSLVAVCQSAIQNAPIVLEAVVITGGDGQWLSGHLSGPVTFRKNLVFEGIRRFAAGL